ncbi:MAG TPA: iron ABC transporter permease [Alphaproteobacteria bacterium]|nr:iron ABC transporter permease [Alphaproteobacteria bacterium]
MSPPLPRPAFGGWTLLAVTVAGLVALPVLVVLSRVFADSAGVWGHLASTVLPDYVRNTGLLMLGVGSVSAVLGVGTAWLVTMHRFPGARMFEWALLLPLAVPTYVMGYVYTDLLDVAGPVQAALRDLTGWGARDYWFPNLRTLPGAVFVMGFVLYPYVYLLARAAFLEQSVCVLEVSRTLGRGPWRSFLGVGLPLARPAIVAGLALVLMETIADFGTVQYFGVPTFTTGIYRTWFGMGEPIAAAQLAAFMLLFVAVLVLLERWSRGRAKYHHTTGRYRRLSQRPLTGWKGIGACLACALPLALGFLVPAGALLRFAVLDGDPLLGRSFVDFARNSFVLAAVTAGIAVLLATLLAYAIRLRPNPANRAAVRAASLGYAVPGSVIAVGVLIPFAAFDNAVDAFFTRHVGFGTGLILTGTIAALVFAYLVRFLAISYNTIEASLGKISPSMDQASRILGHGPKRTLIRVHAPIMRGGMLTAGLLVFVDVMKELPATLIVRPFNFDTLAVRVYRLASDERLAEASTAALAIVAVGVLPVILLSLAIARSRPGQNGAPPEG